VKAKLPLTVRTLACDTCGMRTDRDLNAAINLKQYVARSGRETPNGRGADQKTRVRGQVAVKRQPRTARADKTGTVPPQGGTADQEFTHAH
jgi:putative transposase